MSTAAAAAAPARRADSPPPPSFSTPAAASSSGFLLPPRPSSSQATPLMSRLAKELVALEKDPPPGIAVWPADDGDITRLVAVLAGPQDTPYQRGSFVLRVRVPDRYPFEPPDIVFETPVYHPNVDNHGRICLDLLKMPPKGSWKPSLNLSTLLTSTRLLLAEPNADDPLSAEIAAEFRENRLLFLRNAREFTRLHACGGSLADGAAHGEPSSASDAAVSATESGRGLPTRPSGSLSTNISSGFTTTNSQVVSAPQGGANGPQKRRLNLSLKASKKPKAEE